MLNNLFVIGALCICFMQGCVSDPNDELSPSAKICYATIQKSGKRIAKRHQLSFVGIGAGGGGEEGIHFMSISFDKAGDPMNRDEARKLIVACTLEFLDDINSNKELRLFLKDYPFTTSNIKLTIFSDIKSQLDPTIAYLEATTVTNENVRYGFIKPTQYTYDHTINEPYKEAVEIVNKNKTMN